MVITEDGRLVQAYAKTIYEAGHELHDMIRIKPREGRPYLYLGVNKFTHKACSAALTQFFLKTDPQPYLFIREDSMDVLVEGLKQHSLDLILSDTPYQGRMNGTVEVLTVARFPIRFCAHKDLAVKLKRFPDDLNGMPFILPAHNSALFEAIQDYFMAHKIKPKIVAQVEDPEMVIKLVSDKVGVAALNAYTISNTPWKQKIELIGPKLPVEYTLHLIAKKRKKMHQLVDHAIRKFRFANPKLR